MKCQSIPGMGRVPMTLANSERLRMLVIQGSKVQLGTNKCLPAFRLVACFGIAEEWARYNLKRGRSPVGRDRTRLAASFHAGQGTHSDPVSADAECSALPTARIISMLASPWEGSNRDLIQFGPLHSWMRRGRGRGKPVPGDRLLPKCSDDSAPADEVMRIKCRSSSPSRTSVDNSPGQLLSQRTKAEVGAWRRTCLTGLREQRTGHGTGRSARQMAGCGCDVRDATSGELFVRPGRPRKQGIP